MFLASCTSARADAGYNSDHGANDFDRCGRLLVRFYREDASGYRADDCADDDDFIDQTRQTTRQPRAAADGGAEGGADSAADFD